MNLSMAIDEKHHKLKSSARNFDWWKPVHEDSPFSYVQFPSFGKHLVSHQMNISLSLS